MGHMLWHVRNGWRLLAWWTGIVGVVALLRPVWRGSILWLWVMLLLLLLGWRWRQSELVRSRILGRRVRVGSWGLCCFLQARIDITRLRLRNGIRPSLGIHNEAHLESGQAEAVSVRKASVSSDVQKLVETNPSTRRDDRHSVSSS